MVYKIGSNNRTAVFLNIKFENILARYFMSIQKVNFVEKSYKYISAIFTKKLAFSI